MTCLPCLRTFKPVRSLRILACGLGAWALLHAGTARASYLDDIGYLALQAELGAGIPTGAGVGVTQVEASASTTSLIYMPDIAHPEFAGKTIAAKSGASTVSGHATSVGIYFYGSSSSLSRSVSTIDVYDANSWAFNGVLKTNGTSAPVVESRRIQNHSWIGTVDNGGATDLDILRRFDFAIQRDDFLAVVGVNNGSGNAVPALLANAYNAISVGLTDGNHSTGVSTVDGSGRVKPEIVAPLSATSFATPLVGSAGALLRQTAPAAGQHSVALKAMLLAGATKDQFANWNRTAGRPLDAHYGAGQLNVQHGYHILAAGQQAASGTESAGKKGWDYNTTAAAGRLYFFDIPATDTASRFSTILTWNRTVADTIAGPGWGNPSSSLADLTLRLYTASGFVKGALVDESLSAVDNIEHLYEPILAPGRYALEVTGSQTGITYGLAWNAVTNVSIAATTPNAAEYGLAPGTFTVTRSGALKDALTVAYTVSGNASAAADYAGLSGTVTIPANQASANIVVSPIADALAEGDETVTVTLASGLAATFASANATVTIGDRPIDAWRFSRFSAAELANPAISGDLADGERDGIVNLVEYALHLDPKAFNASALPTAFLNASGFPTLTYTTVASAVDIGYIVEISTNLVTWNPLIVASPQVVDYGETATVTVSSPTPVSAQPSQFLRLRVTRQ